MATVMGSVYRHEFAEAWRKPGSLFLDSARIAASIAVLRFSRPRSLADYDHHLRPLIAALEAGASDTQPVGTEDRHHRVVREAVAPVTKTRLTGHQA
ncbi:hypothetical protein [Thermomonas sp.]|uniref:hypothetical protein n=1 Tax=Thermomonas sp. TaxID=1971895 RepID=UPI0025DE7DD9|nr:hypothetical protein [Thermomonas sp.]